MDLSQSFAHALLAEDVRHVFSLMGNANMELLVEMHAAGLPAVHARHEGGAVAMADGYARATGKPGVATVTSGPGLVNAALSIAVAARRQVPLVVLAGDTAQNDVTGNQVMDQGPFVTSLGAAFARVEHERSALVTLRHAFERARSQRRPVVVSVPANLQRSDMGNSLYEPSDRTTDGSAPPAPDPTALERATQLLARAQRPVVLAGRGARGCESGLARIAERTGALLATTLAAKGVFDDDPYDVGVVGKIARTAVRSLLDEADCVLAVGASLNPYTTADHRLCADANVIAVDVRSTPAPGTRRADVRIQADATATVSALLDRLDQLPPRQGWRTDDVRARIADALAPPPPLADADGVDPVEVARAADAVMPVDAAVVVGVGHYWWFPVAFVGGRQRAFEFAVDFGAVGQTVPTAIGYAIGAPDRHVVAFEGDGGTLMHLGELDTHARHAPNLTVVVMNDGALGAEYHKLVGRGLPTEGTAVGTSDFATTAAGLGLEGLVLDDDRDASKVIADAVTRSPALVDARTSRARVSEPYRRAHFR